MGSMLVCVCVKSVNQTQSPACRGWAAQPPLYPETLSIWELSPCISMLLVPPGRAQAYLVLLTPESQPLARASASAPAKPLGADLRLQPPTGTITTTICCDFVYSGDVRWPLLHFSFQVLFFSFRIAILLIWYKILFYLFVNFSVLSIIIFIHHSYF